MKNCTVCKQDKPLDSFSNNKKSKDGKMNRCEECNRMVVMDHYNRIHGAKEDREFAKVGLETIIQSHKDQGRTLKEISELTGLHPSSISYYLNGKRKIGMNAVRKFNKHYQKRQR